MSATIYETVQLDSDQHTLLIVDDDDLLRSSLYDTFTHEGYDVLEARNGNEAIELMANANVDLVVSDVRMPGGDGINFIQKINAIPAAKRPSVIFVSGYNDLLRSELMVLGVRGVIDKPFERADLLAMVRKVLKEPA